MGLVRYPATLAPASGVQTVTVQCADNAHITSSNLMVRCSSSGNWLGELPQCECDNGYISANISGIQICKTNGM